MTTITKAQAAIIPKMSPPVKPDWALSVFLEGSTESVFELVPLLYYEEEEEEEGLEFVVLLELEGF